MKSKSKYLNTCFNEDLEESSLESTHSDQTQCLNRKTKRPCAKSNKLTHLNLIKEQQCDICLDYEKYTTSRLIKCITCNAQCHQNCYQSHFTKDDLSCNDEFCALNFQCLRCENATNHNKSYSSIKCAICAESNGILDNIKKNEPNGAYSHLHCIKFIKELIEIEDYDKSSIICNNDAIIRKWRYKSTCKICKEKLSNDKIKPNNKAVIKCMNTKCNCYYHIPCAIKQCLLYPIDFQYDFYGINKKDWLKKSLPFYCLNHNKNIANEYEDYIKQMELFLAKSNNIEDEAKDKSAMKTKIECNKNIIDFEELDVDEDDDINNKTNPLKLNFDTWFYNDQCKENDETIFNDNDDDYQRNDFFVWKFDEL